MSKRYLTIMEVSQKQAYIFQSNKLKDNIINSAVIAHIMGRDYLRETAGSRDLFDDEKNFVYSGGGHTVLEFPTKEQAVQFTKKITGTIKKDYPGIEIFAKTIGYDEGITPAENLSELTKALERKKSVRKSAFHQGSFGVEKIDSNTLKPILLSEKKQNKMPPGEEHIDRVLQPEGFHQVYKFEELGGTKNTSNFIAVVHIDGNAMGKRVENMQQNMKGLDWESYKNKQRRFSESIDDNFKEAYREMSECAAENIRSGKLEALSMEEDRFPVRRIITAGDDICFVAEGRIGIECARIFIEKLGHQKNEVDGEGYAACAGVAIVHQKYPFYKAYELAEMLCSNAKKYGAGLSSDGTGRDVSVIDWHIEFGEVKDTLEEIRMDYIDADGKLISARPYIVRADCELPETAKARKYDEIRKQILQMQKKESSARGTLKELRSVCKRSSTEIEYYLKFHRIEELVNESMGGDYCILFDAIELIDTFIGLDSQEGQD